LTTIAAPFATVLRTTSPVMSRYAHVVLIAAIAWGAFSFGAVYPWAYWPIAAAITVVGIVGLLAPLPDAPPLGLGALFAAFGAFGIAVILQLVPVRLALIRLTSPETMGVLNQFDLPVGTGVVSKHPFSIDPVQTLTGFALFGALALLTGGAARLLSSKSARGICEAITVVGIALALTGVIQQSLFAGKIYGFWPPPVGGESYGPFVNRNHFAGWMLMAVPLSLGLVCGRIARTSPGVNVKWRDRIVWFSSPDANRLILLAGAALLMTLSLVLTMSRSGMSALVLALSVTGVVALRRQDSRGGRMVRVAYLTLLVLGVVAWVRADVIMARFAQTDWSQLNGRRGAWADAWNIATLFPLTGTGLNTYGVATLFYQRHDVSLHYVQAHNDYLQIVAEGGLLLAVPALMIIGAFVAIVRRRFSEETSTTGYWLRAGAVAGLAAIALQETVEFSLQMPGNATLFAVLCAIALHRTPGRRIRAFEKNPPARPAQLVPPRKRTRTLN